jgi:transcriptional regulator with XRE-family HTH domain
MKAINQSTMTMTEIAAAAGISRTGLYLWLRRPGMGRADTAQRIAKVLGVTVEELLRQKARRARA